MHGRTKLFRLAILSAALPILMLLFIDSAYAYIDPGTGNVIYTSLATIIGFGAGILGILFWPVKRFIRRLRGDRSSGRATGIR